MIYFQKIITAFVLPPGALTLIIIIMSKILWRKNKIHAAYLLLIAGVLFVVSTGFFSSLIINPLESKYHPPENITGDVIVMLGGGAILRSPDLEGVGNLTGTAANRLLTAARIQRKLGVPIIISGGQVYEDSGNEAQIAKRILLQLGVESNKIIVEDRSVNTKQNALNVRKLLVSYHFKKPILVTSAFHMPRAVRFFTRERISVQPFPCDYYNNSVSAANNYLIAQWLPTASGFYTSYIALREYLGLMAFQLRLQ